MYEGRLAAGVAQEQARKDLPLSTYTEAYWKNDLHNLLNFLSLRMASHAHQEIRAYAKTIGEQIVAAWVPSVWNAFLDYRQDGLRLSRVERDIVRSLVSDAPANTIRMASDAASSSETPMVSFEPAASAKNLRRN